MNDTELKTLADTIKKMSSTDLHILANKFGVSVEIEVEDETEDEESE